MGKKKKKKKNSHITQLKSLFKKIEFSTWDLLFDQYKNMCIPFEVCKNISSRRRVDLIEKCQGKFTEELDLKQLLGKVRDAYGLLRFLKGKESKILQRFDADKVIDQDDESEESDHSNTLDFNSNFSSDGKEFCFDESNPTNAPLIDLRENFRKLIIKGIQVDDKIKMEILDRTIQNKIYKKIGGKLVAIGASHTQLTDLNPTNIKKPLCDPQNIFTSQSGLQFSKSSKHKRSTLEDLRKKGNEQYSSSDKSKNTTYMRDSMIGMTDNIDQELNVSNQKLITEDHAINLNTNFVIANVNRDAFTYEKKQAAKNKPDKPPARNKRSIVMEESKSESESSSLKNLSFSDDN